MRKMMLALGCTAMVLPTMLVPVSSAEARREWRGRDGRTYCKKNNGTTGTIIGGVGGALLGRTVGTLGGAVLGGLAGRAIDKGSSNNNRRCR